MTVALHPVQKSPSVHIKIKVGECAHIDGTVVGPSCSI